MQKTLWRIFIKDIQINHDKKITHYSIELAIDL